MTKADLIKAVAERSGLDRRRATRAVEAILDTMKNAIAGDGGVQLVGFGTFAARARAARKGRDPKTGAEIEIPARRVVAFRAGKELRQAVAARR